MKKKLVIYKKKITLGFFFKYGQKNTWQSKTNPANQK